jgi:hypothetical protein
VRSEISKKFWPENVGGRDHLRELGTEGRIILKQILEKWGVRICTRFYNSVSSSEYGSEISGLKMAKKLLINRPFVCHLLRNNSVLCSRLLRYDSAVADSLQFLGRRGFHIF